MLAPWPMSECYDWTDEPEAEQRKVFSQLRRLDDGQWCATFEPSATAPLVADTPRAALTRSLRALGDRACGLERGLAELDRLEQAWRTSPLRALRGGGSQTPRSELGAA